MGVSAQPAKLSRLEDRRRRQQPVAGVDQIGDLPCEVSVETSLMLKSAIGIGSCLGVAVAATALGTGPAAAGIGGFAAGVAINFGHELCKRFGERASAYAEKIWGLDKNEHIGRGVRRAQIAATREVLRLWSQELPQEKGRGDDSGHALATLLTAWCDEQDKEKVIEQWANSIHDSDRVRDGAALRRAFETAFGAEVDESAGMAERARRARELAANIAFEEALEGALSHARLGSAKSIRESAELKSFTEHFKAPARGGGWFDAFLVVIGKQFKSDDEFKRLWDSVQLGGISAMLLDDIKLSAERHSELQQFIRWSSGELWQSVSTTQANSELILLQQSKSEQEAERRHREIIALISANVRVAQELGIGPPLSSSSTMLASSATDQGEANRQAIGLTYDKGRGVERSDRETVASYCKAAEEGDANGQVTLGLMYANGRGVEKDDREAVAWLRKAAEQGNANGQVTLGLMYREGRGVERNDREAVAWYRKAAEQGNQPAKARLAAIRLDSTGQSMAAQYRWGSD